MFQKSPWYYLKIFVLLCAVAILFWGSYKVFSYYQANALYAHYIVKSYFHFRSPVVENGYTNKSSYAAGDKQLVYINAREEGKAWLRLYNIEGKVVDSLLATIEPQEEQENAAVAGFGYKPSFEYSVSPALPSGLYLWEKCIPFVVKGKEEPIAILYPNNTIQAYNVTGGKSFYSIFSEQSPVISFHRPVFPPVSFQVHDGLEFFSQYKQYPLRYLSDQDMDNYQNLKGAKVLVIIGHSEYWTRRARINFDRFVEEGGHVVVLSGNTMWWQVRFDSLQQQLICYKHLPDPIENPLLKTINWPDALLNYPVIPSIGASFTYGGFGRRYDESFDGLKVVAEDSPLLKGTNLQKEDIISVPTKEYDGSLVMSGKEHPYQLNQKNLPFTRAELIAWDRAYDDDPGLGTFLIFQKNDSSGIVINTATMDWCSGYGMGGKDSLIIRQITRNMLESLMEGKELFSREGN